MNPRITSAISIIVAAAVICGCEAGEKPEEIVQYTERVALDLTPFSALNAGEQAELSHAGCWEKSVLVKQYRYSGFVNKNIVTTDDAHYPRLARLGNGSWILSCHGATNGNTVYYATSPDLRQWENRGILFGPRTVKTSQGATANRIYTNGQLLPLRNGDVLAIASYRISPGYSLVESQPDHGIAMKRSSDFGKTWSEESEIYHGTNWEGQLLELENGQLQCYFSESRPWISGGHSGTGMILSDDGGKTWSPDRVGNPRTVVRESYVHYENGKTLYTDQMPAVIKLVGSPGYAGAFEARRSNSSAYGISLAWSPDGLWPELVDSDGSYPVVTAGKCGPAERHSYAWTGTAPTMMQFPSGETVVGYSAMYQGAYHLMYRMGDATAHNFGDPHPALDHQGSWGAVRLAGTHEMIAVNRDSQNSGNVGVSYVLYALNHNIGASSHSVRVDGENRDWPATDEALFVGSRHDAQASLRCSCDSENLYFLIEIIDEEFSSGDTVNLMLAPVGSGFLHGNCISVKASCMGVEPACRYPEREWVVAKDIASKGFSAFDGTPDDDSDIDNGWLCEISIPVEKVPFFEDEILVNLSLAKSQTGSSDSLADTSDPGSWFRIKR